VAAPNFTTFLKGTKIMSFEKAIANRQWFANNVEAGDSVSFVYDGLQRFGEVVESVRLPNPAATSTRTRSWLVDFGNDRSTSRS
jgi:hypothetical protein